MNQSSLFRMKRAGKLGTYTFVGGIILLAILIALNAVMAILPAKITRFDTTGEGLTELAPRSEELLAALDEDVTVYWLCEGGVVDQTIVGDWFDLLLTRYDEASRHLAVKIIDTATDTAFVEKYGVDGYNNHSLVVESAKRTTVVDVSEMYSYSNALVNQLAGEEMVMTYEELQNMQYYVYYSQGQDITLYQTYQHSRANAEIAAAIDYVTLDTVPHAYLLTGFAGEAPTEDFKKYLAQMTEGLDMLDISQVTAIPEDANCLVLYAPTADLSDVQTALITGYLGRGGSLLLATSPAYIENCPNLQSIAATFGLSAAPGLVTDSQSGYYVAGTSTDVLTPKVNTSHEVGSQIATMQQQFQVSIQHRMPQSHAIQKAETLPTGVTVTDLFTTSAMGNRVQYGNVGQVLGTPGALTVATTATRSVATADGTTATAKLTWFGSTEAFSADVAKAISDGNYYYAAMSLATISEPYTSPYEGISAIRLTTDPLAVTIAPFIILSVCMVIVIPFGLLTAGLVIWSRRKRRH